MISIFAWMFRWWEYNEILKYNRVILPTFSVSCHRTFSLLSWFLVRNLSKPFLEKRSFWKISNFNCQKMSCLPNPDPVPKNKGHARLLKRTKDSIAPTARPEPILMPQSTRHRSHFCPKTSSDLTTAAIFTEFLKFVLFWFWMWYYSAICIGVSKLFLANYATYLKINMK